MSDIAGLVDELAAEHGELLAVVRDLDDDGWLTPTPAWGWDVRDTIAHLADTDELAIDTARGGPRPLGAVAARAASSEDVTYRGVLRGRRLPGAEVGMWWARTAAAVRETLLALPPDQRVPWGLGMSPPTLATARLMETWAHGLDVRSALHVPAVDTDRLADVAWLATRALPYAYSVAGREPPDAPVRVELTLPSGAPWTYGPEDAAARISGPAGEYCRVFVQRLRLADTSLEVDGDAAYSVMQVARAYL